MKIIIAEKPSVGREIAQVVGATQKNEKGYFEGNNYIVSWAFGHLVQLAPPDIYGEKSWNLNRLPIVPEKFVYVVNPDAEKQFYLLKDLMSKENVEYVVCATDAGREGEAIFRYIYNLAESKKPVLRLWISSLTKEAIKGGMDSLKPSKDFDALFDSAKARNEADWIIGMNCTRALTLSTQSNSVLSLGRVQTPTLAIICNRYLEHKEFVPTPYYVLSAMLKKGEQTFSVKYPDSFLEKEKAEETKGKIKEAVIVTQREIKDKNEKPPLPFDLTSAQINANNSFNLKAQETLDILQALYEKHKLLTYPRTSSRYLGEDMYNDVVENLNTLKSVVDESVLGVFPKEVHRFCFDSSKLSDHHAIIPTFKNFDAVKSLTANENAIFQMVVSQFLMSIMPICKKSVTSYKFHFSDEEKELSVSGTVIKEMGWRALKQKENTEEKEDLCVLPLLEDGEKVGVVEKTVSEKKTQKPSIHTEASLLKQMETAGNNCEDEEQREALKDCGIGTPATRASIIETLFKRNYIVNEKKRLIPTELGLSVYNIVKDLMIADVSMTGEMERKLNLMAKEKYDKDLFYSELIDFNKQLIDSIKTIGEKNILSTAYSCPFCSSKIKESEKSYFCSNRECDFGFFKVICKKQIDPGNVKLLFEKNKTDLIKGFKTKEGKDFSAKLSIDLKAEERGRAVLFVKEERKIVAKCPFCEKDFLEYEKSYSCSNKECSFFVVKEIAGKKILEKQVLTLIKDKKTELIKGFVSKKKKKFDAFLVLKDKKVEFEFLPKK